MLAKVSPGAGIVSYSHTFEKQRSTMRGSTTNDARQYPPPKTCPQAGKHVKAPHADNARAFNELVAITNNVTAPDLQSTTQRSCHVAAIHPLEVDRR